jgi:hypothetical protein
METISIFVAKRDSMRNSHTFFSKDGAGTEIPVKITGTKSEPHFGFDFGHKDVDKNTAQGQRN